jgi:hypothetical protein
MDLWKSAFELVFGRRGPRARGASASSGDGDAAPSARPQEAAPQLPAVAAPLDDTPAPTAPPREPAAPAPPEANEDLDTEAIAQPPALAPDASAAPSGLQPPATDTAPPAADDDGDDDGPTREPTPSDHDAAPPPQEESAASSAPPATSPDAPAPLVWSDGWNPAVPEVRRLRSPNRRPRGGHKVDRIVVHITGTADFNAARSSFMNPANPASAHYCIDRNGELYQFVSEDDIAWHAGIHRNVDPVYAQRDGNWRKYKRYFHWHRGYPQDAVFLNAQGQPCAREQATLVARADGSPWTDYAYFNARWGEKTEPVGYELTKLINQRSIGIETVGHGGSSPGAYTDEMYQTLAALVADICERHGIENSYGPVCGHEDVNPVERWGWDPGAGFNWSRVVKSVANV